MPAIALSDSNSNQGCRGWFVDEGVVLGWWLRAGEWYDLFNARLAQEVCLVAVKAAKALFLVGDADCFLLLCSTA